MEEITPPCESYRIKSEITARDACAVVLATVVFAICVHASEPVPSLSTDELRTIEACIEKLDADDFQTRENAQAKLVALGTKITPYLSRCLREIRLRSDGSAEVAARLQAALYSIEMVEVDKILEELDSAVDDAPRHFLAPDREIVARLSEHKITFEWSDTPLRDVISLISRHAQTPIVFDPRVANETSGEFSINMRVSDQNTEAALDAVLKLAELERVVRGKAVIITSGDRAQKLKLEARTITLPLAPGDEPWTLEETQALASLLSTWPVRRDESDGAYVTDAPELAQAEAPGRILLHAGGSKLQNLGSFIQSVCRAPRAPALPEWAAEIDAKLDGKVSLEAEKAPLADVLQDLGRRLKLKVVLNSKCATEGLDRAPLTLNVADLPAREAVAELCRRAEMAAEYRNSGLFFSRHHDLALEAVPTVIDVRPALRAGVDETELKSRLDALLVDAQLPEASHVLHGRWLALADAWTAARAAKLIEQSAGERKVVAAPAAPWFFASFKK